MKTKLSENLRGGVFPSQEIFNKIYEECLENQPQASAKVRNSYQEMWKAFENYLCAVEEDTFRYAYQCGYEAGRKGGVVV